MTRESPAGEGTVKCVVWDIDNTLLTGIYLEAGDQPPGADPVLTTVLAELGERGILHALASKNPPAHNVKAATCLPVERRVVSSHTNSDIITSQTTPCPMTTGSANDSGGRAFRDISSNATPLPRPSVSSGTLTTTAHQFQRAKRAKLGKVTPCC